MLMMVAKIQKVDDVGFLHSSLANFIFKTKFLWKFAAEIETSILNKNIKNTKIERPVYICGLARSGTTLLLEKLNATGGFCSFKYKDFPFIFTPYIWRKFLEIFSTEDAKRERFHKDGIYVDQQSPEAFEEVIWMEFFKDIHNENSSQELTEKNKNIEFDAFYKNTISKLLLTQKKVYYLAKGNYNIARVKYILSIFPDAKFIIPFREPIAHIASLQKQHDMLLTEQSKNPKIKKYMDLAGHYEFGLGRKAQNIGNNVSAIKEYWNETSNEHKGWAELWASTYKYVLKELSDLPSVMLVDYDKLCDSPQNEFINILKFLDINLEESDIKNLTSDIKQKKKADSFYDGKKQKEIFDICGQTYKALKLLSDAEL